jgi:hypothetical protein
MRPRRMFLVLIAVLVLNTSVAGQSPSSSPPTPTADRLLGTWKLNADKSSPGVANMSVFIVAEAKDYKITVDKVLDNGSQSYFSIISGMRGETVQIIDKNGKPRPGTCRITLDGPNSFVVDWDGPQDRYDVSPDGQTMTIHHVPGKSGIIAGKVDSQGHFTVTQHVEVLDRVHPPSVK